MTTRHADPHAPTSTPELATRLRSVRAVLAGALVVVVGSTATDAALHATGLFPPLGQVMDDSLFVLALSYRIVLAGLGGALTARLAPRGPTRHALALGAIGALAGIAGVIGTWDAGPEYGPRWYAIAVAATALPSAWAGARASLAR